VRRSFPPVAHIPVPGACAPRTMPYAWLRQRTRRSSPSRLPALGGELRPHLHHQRAGKQGMQRARPGQHPKGLPKAVPEGSFFPSKRMRTETFSNDQEGQRTVRRQCLRSRDGNLPRRRRCCAALVGRPNEGRRGTMDRRRSATVRERATDSEIGTPAPLDEVEEVRGPVRR
jgi:hypothetical protein